MTRENYQLLMDEANYLKTMKYYEEALGYYKMIALFYPNDFYLLRDMGGAYFQLHRFDEAKECYEKILAENLAASRALFLLYTGWCYLGKLQEKMCVHTAKRAVQYIKAALRLSDPLVNSFSERRDLAEAYLYSGKHNKAIKILEKILQEDGSETSPTVFELFAMCYVEKRDFPQAIANIEIAIALEPKEASFYLQQGYIYHEYGKYKKAKKAYVNALKYRPDYADAYNNLSELYYLKKKYKKAKAYAKKALSLENNDSFAYCTLAKSYVKLHAYDKAKQCFQKSLEIDPKLEDARKGLKKIARKEGGR